MQTAPAELHDGVLALVRGDRVQWAQMGSTPREFLAQCDRHELHGLVWQRISAGVATDWPAEILAALRETAHAASAREMLCAREISRTVAALSHGGVRALLLKGAALAYTVYDMPIARPRLDTDLLIDAADKDSARRILEQCGYNAPPYCDQLFSQFQMEKTDEFGQLHVIDVHWKISTQPVFADVLTYEEMSHRAVPVPVLGPAAVAPSFVDALLLACVHPVMHHQNAERLLWTYDTHLLASALSRRDFHEFAVRATQKSVAAVCGHALRHAQTVFDTHVPADDLRALSAVVDEPSAGYLAAHRRWHHELASSMRGLPRIGDRVRLVRDVLLPRPGYMLGVYGLRGSALGPWLLPALYVHRNFRGAWKILTGKK